MRSLAALCVLLLLPAVAAAEPLLFTFGGDDINNNLYTIQFTLDPATPPNSFGLPSFAEFSNVPGTVDGVADNFGLTFDLTAASNGVVEQMSVDDSENFYQEFFFSPNGDIPFFTADSNGNFVVNTGTYDGFNWTDCSIFDVPKIHTNCGEYMTGSAASTMTGSSGVTPEPSTLALFGTGLLGMAILSHWRLRRGDMLSDR